MQLANNLMKRTLARLCLIGFGVSLGSSVLLAAPITPGNIVIYRVGDGSAALSTAAAAVFLDEYTPSGSLVQSIALPASGSGAFTAVGNATSEGVMSFSQNGSKIIFTGYRKAAGGSSPSSDAPSTTPRVIGLLDPSTGNFDTTSYAATDVSGTIRSATSTDGSSLFYVGASSGVRYVGSPGPSSTSVQIDSRNSRQVLLKDNVLYASNGSTTITGKVQHYGVLPTTSTTATPIVSLATGDAVHGIAFFDLNGSIAGVDTLYAMSVLEGRLRKYSFDGSTWQDNGFLSFASMGQGNVDGYVVSGGAVQLFFSTGSALVTLTDSSGWNGTLSGTFSTLASAPANTAFRGLVAVVPEPNALGLLAFGLAGLILLRRRG